MTIPTPTMTELRIKNPLFFSRDTLNFFGQTLHMFVLKRSPSGTWFLFAPSYMYVNHYTKETKLLGYTFREIQDNLSLTLPEGEYDKTDLDSILEYIERN